MRVALLTISDSVSRGTHQDASGPALAARCAELGWKVVGTYFSPDEEATIKARLIEMAESGMADLILSTGGTGIGPRDVTPEATYAVCTRVIPGLSEMMRDAGRRANPRAALSRALAGVCRNAIVVNLPGSPRGAVESLNAVADLLPHAVEVLHGARHD